MPCRGPSGVPWTPTWYPWPLASAPVAIGQAMGGVESHRPGDRPHALEPASARRQPPGSSGLSSPVLTILLANYAITHWGKVPAFPGGRTRVPVWPGHRRTLGQSRLHRRPDHREALHRRVRGRGAGAATVGDPTLQPSGRRADGARDRVAVMPDLPARTASPAWAGGTVMRTLVNYVRGGLPHRPTGRTWLPLHPEVNCHATRSPHYRGRSAARP
jgi:hypothetical protein